ncbi:hypothetical protein HanPSC8_Chr14g0613031 [Helianthus annuus]|nr:hypothetical protein HanPSC8_Chr14g0613031 [Helianthus annuus]
MCISNSPHYHAALSTCCTCSCKKCITIIYSNHKSLTFNPNIDSYVQSITY